MQAHDLKCALCRGEVSELPDDKAINHSLPDWLRKMSGKGFRCTSCGEVICTHCLLRLSLNPLGPTASSAVNSFLGQDKVGSGLDASTVCALCIKLELDEAACPKCQSRAVGYAGREEREQQKARQAAEKRRQEAARKAEANRVQDIMLRRQVHDHCTHCGKALGFLDRLLRRAQHPACTAFRD